MKTTRISLALLLALALTVTWTWADGTDFSGTWKLNADKSDQPGGGGGGRGGGRGGRGGTSPEITVTQTDETITVSTNRGETVYKPGAGPQEITGGRMGGTQEARWDGARLVIDRNVSTQRGDFKITTVWSLSEDGGTLTQEVTRSTPQGARTFKAVYDKQ